MKKSECTVALYLVSMELRMTLKYTLTGKKASCSFQGVVTLKAWIDSHSNLTPPLCPLPFSKTLFYMYKLIRVQNQPLCM